MRVLVAYYTQTGNTRKIAQAIHSELESLGHEVTLREIRGVKSQDVSGFDVIFLGSPCHSADLAKPVRNLLEAMESSPGGKLAGFVTHSTYTAEGGERHRELHERWAGKCAGSFEQACAAKGLEWSGCFSCQGKPSKPIELFIRVAVIKDAHEWPGYIAETRKHPNADDEAKARAFAREVVALGDTYPISPR
ncbi:MAG: flavodoxin family protein [Candidatus Bipolaricaulis sp.]|nr:flavodoxin family protein [Candidatus Bipolaricaulis sp.]